MVPKAIERNEAFLILIAIGKLIYLEVARDLEQRLEISCISKPSYKPDKSLSNLTPASESTSALLRFQNWVTTSQLVPYEPFWIMLFVSVSRTGNRREQVNIRCW